MKNYTDFLQPQRIGLLLLRWYLACALLLHGIAKVQNGIAGIEKMVVAHSLPAFIAYGVFIGELVAPH